LSFKIFSQSSKWKNVILQMKQLKKLLYSRFLYVSWVSHKIQSVWYIIISASDSENSIVSSGEVYEPSCSSNNSYNDKESNGKDEPMNVIDENSILTNEKTSQSSKSSHNKGDPCHFSLADFIPSQSSSTVSRKTVTFFSI
jgi:hypothetical protein